jgi:DNA-directed RNA polymerase subunit M/transcription elongation factor TFIIS
LPQRIFCGKCKNILYEDDIDVIEPNQIILKYDGVCPNCGKKLNFNPENINIIPIISEEVTQKFEQRAPTKNH